MRSYQIDHHGSIAFITKFDFLLNMLKITLEDIRRKHMKYEVTLTDAYKGFTYDQDKIFTPEHTVKRFREKLEKLNLDILKRAVRIDNGRLGIPIYFSLCGADAANIIGTKKQMGKGGTPQQAEASACMELAERFEKPLITMIDTPGAYPGQGAEERGQSVAIAENLQAMAVLKVPIVTVVIGEGGSGGALALGVGDRILMFEHATYSVISPEGCAAILWKSEAEKERAAEALKGTASDLLAMGVIDEIVPEPLGGAHQDLEEMTGTFAKALSKNLNALKKVPVPDLVQKRYEKFRRMGNIRGG